VNENKIGPRDGLHVSGADSLDFDVLETGELVLVDLPLMK